MPVIRAQVTIPYDSGLPEDVAVNTFHFFAAAADQQAIDDVNGLLDNFYSAIPAGEGGAFTAFYSNIVNSAAARIKTYNLDSPEPRQPLDTYDPQWAWAGAGSPLPQEVALCLSFQAVGVSGSPQARRRGRVYLGPLAVTAIEASTSDARPESDLISRMASAASELLADSITSTARWVVYSEAAGGVGYNVDNGWVDNAFDIQRRRGVAPTARTTFS